MTDHASLKAIQKKALLSFYERHHSAWKSEPQLSGGGGGGGGGGQQVPPHPPPRNHPPPPPHPSRRSSSASDYAASVNRDVSKNILFSLKGKYYLTTYSKPYILGF
jgi:hypothetical protein